jgi:hypothetical protein
MTLDLEVVKNAVRLSGRAPSMHGSQPWRWVAERAELHVTCTLTHLIELDESRDIVRRLIGEHREPQALIRIGISPRTEDLPAATPGPPLDAVLQLCERDDV